MLEPALYSYSAALLQSAIHCLACIVQDIRLACPLVSSHYKKLCTPGRSRQRCTQALSAGYSSRSSTMPAAQQRLEPVSCIMIEEEEDYKPPQPARLIRHQCRVQLPHTHDTLYICVGCIAMADNGKSHNKTGGWT